MKLTNCGRSSKHPFTNIVENSTGEGGDHM